MKIKDSDQTKYWWTADLHFKHRNIVEFTNRGVDTTQEDHDEWLINLWNSQVGKNDVVFHLGDFVFNCRKLDVLQSYLNRLNGKIILIRGNHDDKQTLNQSGLEWYDIKGVSLNNGGEKSKYVVMCHYPMRVWDKSAHGSWMLHGHCVDESTEILTSNGWKFRESLVEDEVVASYDSLTGKVVYEPISEIHDYVYSGEMYSVKGKSVDFRGTSKHRIVGYRLGSDKYSEVTPDQRMPKLQMIHSGHRATSGVKMSDEELRLYVYCTADGSLKEETGLWRIKVKKEHKISEVKRVLEVLHIPYNEYRTGDYVSYNFHWWNPCGFSSKGLDDSLRDISSEQFKVFIDAYSLSDGSKNGNGITLTTAKKCEADLIQELAVTHGWSCASLERIGHGFSKNPSWQLSVYPRTMAVCDLERMKSVEVVENEKVWCVTTRTGNFFMRRNGKVHVTGNSHGSLMDVGGKILDVGLDNAYNIFGEHKFFTTEDLSKYMDTRDVTFNDHHGTHTKQ